MHTRYAYLVLSSVETRDELGHHLAIVFVRRAVEPYQHLLLLVCLLVQDQAARHRFDNTAGRRVGGQRSRAGVVAGGGSGCFESLLPPLFFQITPETAVLLPVVRRLYVSQYRSRAP